MEPKEKATWRERLATTYASLPTIPFLKKSDETKKPTDHETIELLESGRSVQPSGAEVHEPTSPRKKRPSLYHEANDYGLIFVAIASASMIL